MELLPSPHSFILVSCYFFALHFICMNNEYQTYKLCIKYEIISVWIASGKSSIYYIYHICTIRTIARCQSFYCFRTFWRIAWMAKVAFVVKISNEVLLNNCVIITHDVVAFSLLLSLMKFASCCGFETWF